MGSERKLAERESTATIGQLKSESASIGSDTWQWHSGSPNNQFVGEHWMPLLKPLERANKGVASVVADEVR